MAIMQLYKIYGWLITLFIDVALDQMAFDQNAFKKLQIDHEILKTQYARVIEEKNTMQETMNMLVQQI